MGVGPGGVRVRGRSRRVPRRGAFEREGMTALGVHPGWPWRERTPSACM